jgi:hypothetical protein
MRPYASRTARSESSASENGSEEAEDTVKVQKPKQVTPPPQRVTGVSRPPVSGQRTSLTGNASVRAGRPLLPATANAPAPTGAKGAPPPPPSAGCSSKCPPAKPQVPTTTLRRSNSVSTAGTAQRPSAVASARGGARAKSPPSAASSALGRAGTSRGRFEYVDSPEGAYTWCFPFSPETEELSWTLASVVASGGSSNSLDQVLRSTIAEVRKRDAKLTAAVKAFAEQYREFAAAKRHPNAL